MLRNYIAKSKAKTGSVGKITMEELRKCCIQYSAIPTDVDEGFIIGSNFDDSDVHKPKIVIVFSTLRRIKSNEGETVYIDAAHKVTWHKKPVSPAGTVDKDRVFHSVLIAVSSYETHIEYEFIFKCWLKFNPQLSFKYIMADAAEAPINAAKVFWPLIVRLTCNAHRHLVSKNFDVIIFDILFYYVTYIL